MNKLKRILSLVLVIALVLSSPLLSTASASAYEPCNHSVVYDYYIDTVSVNATHTYYDYWTGRINGQYGTWYLPFTCYYLQNYYLFGVKCESCSSTITTFTVYMGDSGHDC